MTDDCHEFDLFSRLRSTKTGKRRTTEPATQRSSHDPEEDNIEPGAFNSEEYSNSSALPGVDEALQAAQPRFREEHDQWELEEQKRLEAGEQGRLAMEERQKSVEPAKSVFALPEITWHVPMTSFDYLKEEKEKAERMAEVELRAQTLSQLRNEASSAAKLKPENKAVKKSMIKEREKAKRHRGGQSTHATWKSEGEMRLRQAFD